MISRNEIDNIDKRRHRINIIIFQIIYY